MGKKQASSAAKAAERAGASARPAGMGFGGFAGSQLVQDVVAVDNSPSDQPSLAGLDPEVAQHLRRLAKRDPTTRLKAVQSLRQCLQDRGPDAIETAVLAWSYSFRRLVMDNVRGVRSEACLLMADIASALGRRIAPHLARLLGPWHFASADAYRDARDNAARGFADLFPGERGAQALQRFAGDVVGFLVETALASPEELGDPSKEPEHELQERHARAVAQAIAAITTLASSGGGSTPGWGKHSLNEHVDRAVTETEIVKAALSHRDGQVRKAACSLLTALSSHRREALRRVCAAMPDKLLGTLADKDPDVCASVLGMVLAVTRACPEVWMHESSVRGGAVSALAQAAAASFYGAALAAAPAMLPLLSVVPAGVRTAETFESLLLGLFGGAAGSTARPQRQAMVSAVAECAAFVAKSEDPRMREVTERFLASVVAPRALGLAVATKDTPTHKHLGKHLDGPFAREAAARVVASVLAAEGDCAAVLKAWLTAQAKTEGDITGKCAEWTALFLAVREAFGRRPSRTEDSGGDEDGLRGIADELVAKGLQGMRADVGDVATAEFVWTMLPRASAGVAREAGEAAAKCLLLCDLPSPAATACARLLVEAVRAGEGDAATWRGALRAFVEDPLRQRALRGLALCLQALLAGADGGVRHSGGGPGVEVEEAASLAMEAATSSRVFGDATRASVLDRMARAGLMPSQVAAQAFAGLVSSVLPRALESPCKPAATVQSWGVLRDAGPQLVATALADAGGSDGEGARGVWDTVVQALAGLLKRTFGASDADVRDAAAALEAATRVGGGAVVDRTATEGLQRGAARVAWAGVQSGLASKGITSDSSKRLWGEVCESAKEDLCSHVRNATAVMGRLCHSSLGSVVGIADDVCRVVRLEDCGNSGLMEAVMEAVTNAVPASVDAMDASRPAHVALLGALAHKLGSAVVFGTRAGAAAMADVLAVAGSGTEGPPAAERTSGSDKPELAVGAAVGRLAAGAVLSGVLGRHVWDAEDAHGIETGSTASSNDSGEDGRDAETLPSGDGGSDLVERLTNMADLQRLPALACGGRDDRAVGELEAFAPVEVDPVSVSALQHALADLLAQDTNARSGALRWGCYALGVAALAGRHAARGGHGVSSAGIECLLTACREVYRAARAGIVESTERREAPEAWAVQKMAIVTSSLGPALASIEDATLEEDSKRWLDALTSQPTPAIASQDSSAETEKAARGTSVSYLRLAVAAHTLPVLVRRDPSDASGYSQRMAQRAVDLMRSQLTLVAMSGGGFGASGRPDGDSLDEEDELDAAGTSGVPETHQSRDELVGATWAALAHGMGLLDAADWELVLEFLASELTQAVAAFEEVAEAVSDAGWAAAEQQQGDARGDEAFADVIFREGGSSSMLDAASASGADAVARASRKTHSSARTAELLCRCVSMVCGIAESGSGTRAQGSVLPRERTCVPSHTLAGFVATAVLDVVRLVVAAGSVAAVGMACSRGHSEGVSGVSGVSLIVRRWRTSVASQSQLWDAVGKALASLTESGHVTPTSLQQAYNESLDWAPDSGAHPSLALLAACACAGSAPITAPSARILCSPAFLRGAVVASVRGDDTSSQEAAPADWEHERVLAPWLECHLVNEGGVTWLAWTLSALAMFDMAVDGPESPSPEKGGEDRDAAHAAVCDALQSLVTRPAGSRYMNSLAWAAVETGAASAGRQVKGSEGAQPSEGSSGQFLGRHASAWEMLDRGAGLSQLLCGGADPGGVWTQAVVHACLWGMPAVVREWFLQQRDKALATSLKRYVMAVESPLLLQLEVSRCQAFNDTPAVEEDKELSVRANLASREVVAGVEIEDGIGIDLRIRLPEAWPLEVPEVDFPSGTKGVAQAKARRWLLGISVLLRSQNGSVADAIRMWHRSVCRELSGEPCLICYSVLHPTDHSLPRMACKTCSQVFHGPCLYKWFRSAGKSNCPHCQTPW